MTVSEPSLDQSVLDRAEAVALRLAREAGALIRERQDSDLTVVHKGTVDLVTDADQASEVIVAGGIRVAFPDHRLIGEEGTRGAAESPWGWIIDPIDGTTNYAHRYPHFCVSIGLEYEGAPVLGVVYDPMKEEVFRARIGQGAFLNDRPLRVSTTPSLIQSLLASGFSYDISERGPAYVLWAEMNSHAQGVRRDGSAALDMCYVAAGRLDGYYEKPVNSWDIGAGAIIVLEAGGRLTGIDASPLDLYNRQMCATNGLIHDELIDRIQVTLASIPT